MRLPNAEQAEVPKEKVIHYLLSLTHPLGRLKARFFLKLGFHPEHPEALVFALQQLAREYNVVKREQTPYGEKFVVDGWLKSPAGHQARVPTVWIIEKGRHIPRLVTAYPLE